jgi:hypothetical protein
LLVDLLLYSAVSRWEDEKWGKGKYKKIMKSKMS